MRFPGEEDLRNPARRAPGRDRGLRVGWAARGRWDRTKPASARREPSSVDERIRASPRASVRWRWCGSALPSPTSGGPARFQPPARRSAAARSAGSGELTSTGGPPTGCGNASRAACRNWRSSPCRPGAPYSRSPATGCPIASRCARIWCVRPVSSRTRSSVSCGSARSTSKCVIASRALVGVGRDARADAPVAAERRVDRAAARGRAALDEREVLAHELAPGQLRLQRRVHRLGARDDEQPGRVAVEPVHDAGPLRVVAPGHPARRAPARASPGGAARAGCTTTPAGLSTTSRCSSS